LEIWALLRQASFFAKTSTFVKTTADEMADKQTGTDEPSDSHSSFTPPEKEPQADEGPGMQPIAQSAIQRAWIKRHWLLSAHANGSNPGEPRPWNKTEVRPFSDVAAATAGQRAINIKYEYQ
jgi:hypothetical protein